MHSEVILLGERLATFFANVRSLPRVEFTVRHQVTLERKRSTALLTDERPFPRVHASVCDEMMLEREGLFTFATLVWPLGAVQQQMRMKTMFVRETLATMYANVRSFAGVYSRVRREMMLQQERLAALRTGIRPFLRHTDLAAHVLLLFHLGLDLRCIHMSENMAKVSGAVRLVRSNIVRRASLIGRRGGSLHQDFIALFRCELQRPERCHEVLAHGVLVGREDQGVWKQSGCRRGMRRVAIAASFVARQ